MDKIETLTWGFLLSFFLVFFGLLVIASKQFAAVISLYSFVLRLVVGIIVAEAGILLFNMTLKLKDSINSEEKNKNYEKEGFIREWD